MKRIYLKREDKAFTYKGNFKYLTVLNRASGRKERYDAWILTVEDPVCIARELTLSHIRNLIAEYEAAASGFEWNESEREIALKIQDRIYGR